MGKIWKNQISRWVSCHPYFVGAALWQCRTDDSVAPGSLEEQESPLETGIQLGKQLENPYSVKNMQRAWDNISGSGGVSSADIEVKTTHYYVKFTPLTEDELDILKDDTTLILFDYPLDREIKEGSGGSYRDPSIPEGQPTPQYCAVEADYVFPSRVGYKILEELFIPDDSSGGGAQSHKLRQGEADEELINRLVHEAMKLTGNLEDTSQDEDPAAGLFSGNPKWRLAGRLMVWDDAAKIKTSRRVFIRWEYYTCRNNGHGVPDLDDTDGNINFYSSTRQCRRGIYRTEYITTDGAYVPLEGVEVRARRWFTVHKGFTNAKGYYSCDGKFRNPANYSIKWDRNHFSVRSGTIGQALYNGPKKRGDWHVDFGTRGSKTIRSKQQYYALIFQAARDYYYGNRFGLSSPPRNSFWKPQVKISASQTARQHKKPDHAAPYARTGGIFPSVYIRRWDRSAERIYGITCHELAHLAHWDMDRSAYRKLFNNSGAKSLLAVGESWARGVEWQFAGERYRNRFGNSNYKYKYNYQYQTIKEKPIYTSIVVDMIDDENQRITNRSIAYPLDRVSGYTIQQIEAGLRGATSWNGWRDNMRNKHNNSTKNFLSELFGNWY